jgi:protein transport protein SEC23
VEYLLDSPRTFPPVFLFVVDTVSSEKEHGALKSLLLLAISIVPPESLVGFISFGNLVYIRELQVTDFP